ncbi:hypothetical protein [Balneola vulgaris]|uniref:hypothetical protein n=1 Tax=Balneola vulgaris TaxID=287535 RepID=UPI0012FB9F19|nr:hypothetical protein [Balneola vulgaris]
MKLRVIPILTLLVLVASTMAHAQSGGFAGASFRLGFGPKSMAMGNASSAHTKHGSYAFYNPALSAIKADYTQLDLSVAALAFDRNLQSAGIKFDLPPTAGLSFNLLHAGVSNIDGRSQSGYPSQDYDSGEYQLLAAFGLRLSSKFNAGIGFKLNYSSLHPDLEAASTVGIDIGTLYHLNEEINIAFVIQDLLAEYQWNSAELYNSSNARNVINKFPVRYKWAVAYQVEKYTLSVEYELQSMKSEVDSEEPFVSNGEVTFIETIETISSSAKQLRFGGSWLAHERVTIYGGYQVHDLSEKNSNGLSTGFSVHLPFDKFSPSIDYAFITEPYQVSNMHMFSINLKL